MWRSRWLATQGFVGSLDAFDCVMPVPAHTSKTTPAPKHVAVLIVHLSECLSRLSLKTGRSGTVRPIGPVQHALQTADAVEMSNPLGTRSQYPPTDTSVPLRRSLCLSV